MLVKQVFAGAKRILAQHTSKKEPITVEILQSLALMFGKEEASLADICTLSICLLSFVGFLWSDEIANLKESDILIFEEHLEVYIESSKTDQYRDGAWVVITHAHSNMCPVHMLESELHVPVRWSGLNGRCIFCRLSAANQTENKLSLLALEHMCIGSAPNI